MEPFGDDAQTTAPSGATATAVRFASGAVYRSDTAPSGEESKSRPRPPPVATKTSPEESEAAARTTASAASSGQLFFESGDASVRRPSAVMAVPFASPARKSRALATVTMRGATAKSGGEAGGGGEPKARRGAPGGAGGGGVKGAGLLRPNRRGRGRGTGRPPPAPP